MRRIGIGCLWTVGAYLLGAFGGGFLTSIISSNQHDRDLEAMMAGAFFWGPIAAIIGLGGGIWIGRRNESGTTTQTHAE
ncbi:hypothetical protein FBQ87_15990 [Sphingobacteriales bacterium CHB3]|nr:hypothetical protein [Sphingobacteriales bacterium CHB3]